MNCASCGSVNREGRRFCGKCGAPLAKVCAACNAVNDNDESYCGQCGAALDGSVAEQLLQVAQVAAQLLRGDGGVFPALPSKRLAGNVRSRAQTRFADFPDLFDLNSVGKKPHVRRRGASLQCCYQSAGLSFGFGSSLSAEFS